MADTGSQDTGILPTLQSMIGGAETAASNLSKPVFDAAGNVLGWVAATAAPYLGTETAVELSTDTGAAIGYVAATDSAAVNSALQAGANVVAPVYDETGKAIGAVVHAATDAAAQIVKPVTDTLTYVLYGGLALVGIWLLYELMEND